MSSPSGKVWDVWSNGTLDSTWPDELKALSRADDIHGTVIGQPCAEGNAVPNASKYARVYASALMSDADLDRLMSPVLDAVRDVPDQKLHRALLALCRHLIGDEHWLSGFIDDTMAEIKRQQAMVQ